MEQYGFRVDLAKCSFAQKSVECESDHWRLDTRRRQAVAFIPGVDPLLWYVCTQGVYRVASTTITENINKNVTGS